MKRFVTFILTIMAVLMTGCSSTPPGPKTFVITKAELATQLGQPFPVSNRILDVMDVKVQAPLLQMNSFEDRIHAEFDLAVNDRVFKNNFLGSSRLSFKLKFSQRDMSLRVTDVRIEQMNLGGPSNQRVLSRLGSWIANDSITDYPVYHIKREYMVNNDDVQYDVGKIMITDSLVEVTMIPRINK